VRFFSSSSSSRARSKWQVGVAFLTLATYCLAQSGPVDPGVRAGQTGGAGNPIAGLTQDQQTFFNQALNARFIDEHTVNGTPGGGLGPAFNGISCVNCHVQPATGGSSPTNNPLIQLATLNGAKNTVPSFLTPSGPAREVRFISTNPSNINAPLDGSVHNLFTIAGRSDAPAGCNLAQPNFAAEVAANNVSFRIPTPLFGLGLVENTPDSALAANLAANASQKAALGIGGSFNTSPNDNTIARFGWKAQNKSLLLFSGEAYNVEMGVTNELFPNERVEAANCNGNATPENTTNINNPFALGANTGTASQMSSDIVNFAIFMKFLAPVTPVTSTQSQLNGQSLFSSVGCALCHSTSLTTTTSPNAGLSQVTYHPYSDFALHHMGSNLADGIVQGQAGPDQFRTAPLWGLGQRIFFLHDGRTTDLLQAIAAHSSPGNNCVTTQTTVQFVANNTNFQPTTSSQVCASEANGVITKFNALTASQKQDLLNFLRSL